MRPPTRATSCLSPAAARRFSGFDRNPCLAAFSAGPLAFVLVNVHLYYGDDGARAVQRRCLEAYAVARWADLRRRQRAAYCAAIILLGDFNLPARRPGDPVHDALTRRGLLLPAHSTRIGSSVATDHCYDQIGFVPGPGQRRFSGRSGVFDFDGAAFARLWRTRPREAFLAYLRYHLSDHRPLWVELAV